MHILGLPYLKFVLVQAIHVLLLPYLFHMKELICDWKICNCHAIQLTLNPLTWRIWSAPNNASRWQMGFHSVFKGLNITVKFLTTQNYKITVLFVAECLQNSIIFVKMACVTVASMSSLSYLTITVINWHGSEQLIAVHLLRHKEVNKEVT